MIEVRQIDPKQWGLYVNGILIGTSKYDFDAQHAKFMLEKALNSPDTEGDAGREHSNNPGSQ